MHEAQTLYHANFLFEKCCQGGQKRREKEEEEKASPCNYRVIGLNVPLSPTIFDQYSFQYLERIIDNYLWRSLARRLIGR